MYAVASFLPASAPRTGPYLLIPPDELQDDIQNNPDANDEEMVEGEEVTMDSLMAGYAQDAPQTSLIQQVLPLPTGDALHEFEEDSDSEENMEVNESDEVVILCKIDNAVSYLEMCVFDTTTYNLYTHHDLCVGEMSCSMCWIDVDPTDGKQGSFVAIGHMDGEISLWDLRIVNVPGPSTQLGGKKDDGRFEASSHTDSILALDWNPHSKRLASAGADGRVKIWRVETQDCMQTIELSTEHPICALQWHPREPSVLLAASKDNAITMINTNSNAKVKFQLSEPPESVSWHKLNPACFFVALQSGQVQLLDVRKQEKGPLWSMQCHEDDFGEIAINQKRPDIIATAGASDDTIRLWRVQASGLDLLAEKEVDIGTILDIGFGSETHPSLMVIGGERDVAIWDIAEINAIKALF